MKKEALQKLQSKLKQDLSHEDRKNALLVIVDDLRRKNSFDLMNYLEKGLELDNLNFEEEFELRRIQLIKTKLDNKAGNVKFLSLEKFITDHKLGSEYENILSFIKLNSKFREERKYEEVVKLGNDFIAEKLNAKNLSNRDKLTKARLYNVMAWCEKMMGNFNKSLPYFEKSLAIYEALDCFMEVGNTYDNIGNLFSNDKNFEKAQFFIEKSLAFFKEKDIEEYSIKSISHYGASFLSLLKFDEATHYYQKTYELAFENDNLTDQIYALNNLCRIYLQENKNEDFLKTRDKIFKHYDFIKEDRTLAISFCRISIEGFLKVKQYENALIWADKFDFFQNNATNIIDLERVYNFRIEIYKGLEDKDKEIEYLNKYLALKDIIQEEVKRKSVEEFDAKFKNQEKENRINELKIETLIYQQQSLRSQMNPHFIFNSIGSISQSITPENISETQNLLNRFARLMRSSLNFAELEKISLEEEINFLEDYLTLEKSRLKERLNYSIEYPENLDIDFIDFPSMLVQPYIENAIKHGISPLTSRAGEIKITFREIEDNFIECKIIDNGVGRIEAEKRSAKTNFHLGKSTKITAKRLKLLNQSQDNDIAYVEYTDLKDEQGNAIGTVACIQVKV